MPESKPSPPVSQRDIPAGNSVDFFREASPYIRQHRERVFVIAMPGEVLEQANFRRILQDIAIIVTLGVRVILVHGTRPQIDNRLQTLQHPIHYHHDLRITDSVALQAAKEACGFVRIQIENTLAYALSQRMNTVAGQHIISGNFVTARPVGILDGIDYGYTGQIRRINHQAIRLQLENRNVVLLSPLGYSPSGEAYNLRYEQLTVETAQALQADKVLFLSHTPLNLPTELTLEEARQYPNAHALLPMMIDALQHKVERVHLLEAHLEGALLLELYTRDGVGCMISANPFESIRQATVEDISGILEIIRPLEHSGTLVKRSREQLELEISNFQVVERDQQIIACAALYATDDPQISELACLAVHAHYRTAHRGEQLLNAIAKLAKAQGKTILMVLTTQTTDWFRERGFVETGIDNLPANKRQLYNYKRNSKVLFKTLAQ
ncbi:MAG: amino-acid N-acetyltransferase [Proteobacteria bacterium]|nr:MAG: amino-acid N-acetyltransferase [Pseudomonadota bacterium]